MLLNTQSRILKRNTFLSTDAMAVSLYDYQEEAVKKLQNGSILCGGVGSGKSRTSLAYYYICQGGDLQNVYNLKDKKIQDLYVITTARKRDTFEWQKDMSPFLLHTDPEFCIYDCKVTVDSWNNISKYTDAKDAFFIFDEQRVVGTGAWVKAFWKITAKNNWILLSATPGDNWSDYMPVFVANGFFKNKTEFTRNHIIYSPFITKFPKIDRYVNEGRLIRLRQKILVDMDYHTPATAHHQTVICDYDRLSYNDIMKNRWNHEKQEPISSAADLCYQLRKVCNSDGSRLLELLKIVNEKKRVIIFYNFDYELALLKDLFKDWALAEWNGHKHQPIPQNDKTDDISWVYLVQYTSGCEGWNCITTDTLVFFSQNYSYKVMIQAAGRIDRLNTPFSDLYYYHLRCNAPIDLGIQKALKSKKKFNESRFIGKKLENKPQRKEYSYGKREL